MADEELKTLFKIVKGPDEGAEFKLDPGSTYIIGRGADAEVRLTDNTVSHEHASVESTNGIWFVMDMGSKHGTLVNKLQIRGRKALFDRDTIRVGKTLLEFREYEELGQQTTDEAKVGLKPKSKK